MLQCKLILKDEVNIRIEGLPIEIRRKLVNKFRYIDPTAKYRPAFKLGRWDGSINFFGIGGDGYLTHLPIILEILEQNNVEVVDMVDLRRPVSLTFPTVTEDFWGDTCWPEGHPKAGEKIRLRDDQVEALNLFAQNPQSIQSLSTGYGKTILTATMVKLCEPIGRTITIVPSKSLVEQTLEDFLNCGLDAGVYYGDKKELNKTHTICTWQSLSSLAKLSRNDDVPPELLPLDQFLDGVVGVIVDECHGLKAPELKSLMVNHLNFAPIRWALTGTIPPEEYNAQSLYTCIGHVVNTVTASELQEQGFLSSCHIHIHQLYDHYEFKKYPDEIKYLTTNKDRVAYMARMIEAIAETGNTLILVNRIDTGEMLQKLIPGSVFISGAVKTQHRKDEYDTFKTENSKILIATAGVAAVGINIVALYNLVMIEPGKSFVRVIQSIGRGLRKGFGKTHVDIWDIASTCKFSKRHLTERKRYYKEAKYKFTITKLKWDE